MTKGCDSSQTRIILENTFHSKWNKISLKHIQCSFPGPYKSKSHLMWPRGGIVMISVAIHTLQQEAFWWSVLPPIQCKRRILITIVATHTTQQEEFWWSVLPPIQCKRKNFDDQCCHQYNAKGRIPVISVATLTMQEEEVWWSVLRSVQCKRKNFDYQYCHQYNAK